MAKSDRVYSTPPTSLPVILSESIGAHGAVKLSSRSLIPASGVGACQPVGDQREPDTMESTSTERAGLPTLSRRFFMNYVVTAAAAVASAVALPSRSNAGDQEPALPSDLPAWSDGLGRNVPVPIQDLRMQYGYDYSDYPEIFGKMPAGFTLEDQSIEALCHWHRRANEVIDQLSDPSEEELNDYCGLKNRIFGTVLSARPATPRQAAAQLRAVVAEIESLSCETNRASIEEVLDVDDIVKISADLTAATAAIVPEKHVGALQRGRKLTRAGLLTRYQSFLVQELETVSYNLYGERDYAKHTIFFDDAVRSRCTSTDRGYPFFDERTLPDRARAVLESLKIDTETADAIA